MLGSIILIEMMLPVVMPAVEVNHRLHVTGVPAAQSVAAAPTPSPLLKKPFFNPSCAADLVYGMMVVPKAVTTQQVYPPSTIALSFPTQFSWLRTFYHGTVQQLSVVAWSDAPAGNRLAISNAGTTYAAYLVGTSDPNASPVRVQVTAGTMAIRQKT